MDDPTTRGGACQEAALALLELNLRPIPVEPDGKRALIPWKAFQVRPPTEAEVREWWARWPTANVAVVTGITLDCLDLDPGAPPGWPGPDRPLPTALVVRTPRDGRHHWMPSIRGARNSTGKLAPGVDYRGMYGYALAPPSRVGGKSYIILDGSWEAALREPAPEWLVRELSCAAKGETTDAGEGGLIFEGNRNTTLTSLAGALRRDGCSEAGILAALLAENAERCREPLAQSEVAAIAKSIARRPAGGGGPPNEGERAQVLAYLSGAFGVEIGDVRRISGEPPIYEFQIAGEKVTVPAGDLLTERGFAKAVLEAAGKLPASVRKAPGGWARHVNDLLSCARRVEARDASVAGQIQIWAEHYLAHHLPAEDGETILPSDPLLKDGGVWVHGPSFRLYVEGQLTTKFSEPRFAQILARQGFVQRRLWVTTENGKAQAVRMYLVPPEFLPEGQDQQRNLPGASE